MFNISYYNFLIIIISYIIIHLILFLKKEKKYNISTKALIFLFFIYIWIVIEITDISNLKDIIYNLTTLKNPILQGKINILPQITSKKEIILNIILFIPFGILVPSIWKKYNKTLNIILIGCFFSFLIEFFQLFNYRWTDITDLITNTIGTYIGFIIFKLSKLLLKKKQNDKDLISPIIYILYITILLFIFKYD